MLSRRAINACMSRDSPVRQMELTARQAARDGVVAAALSKL